MMAASPADRDQHGGDAVAIARHRGVDPDSLLDLSASLNPLAPDVAPVVGAVLEEVRRYPDVERATHLLASAIGVDADLLVLTNGGAEAIALVAAEEGRGTVIDPEFALYRRHLVEVDDARGAVDGSQRRWRSNPSNPMGTMARAEDTARVWDEAFYPFAVRRDASNHPSPNGGVVEAAFAAALGVELVGVNRYEGSTERRGPLGRGDAPTVADISRAVRLGREVSLVIAIAPVAAARVVRCVR